ncbi:protein arginine kinase [Clostridium hydrogeniformans]|uniref:protein arginine kinase n=1 Tax=Clostridium hydrogeniformans TaxID=349933 RepID=UPI000483EDC6|nr:protein arginine kinase [Clostridium hydrogeniformans]
MENWIDTKNNSNSIVLSSRIRIARNLSGIPFPHKLNKDEGIKVLDTVNRAIYEREEFKNNFNTINLWEISNIEKERYLERHLISKHLINFQDRSAFIISDDETVSIMINEEDHIRLQCITSGLNIKEAYEKANELDNILENNLEYDFDEKLGYITACPTNLGTGLRASVMIHLPALTLNNEINGALKALTQVGMTIRGLYGEGSKGEGNIYQISNQITLGVTEEEIVRNLEGVVSQLVNQEIRARAMIEKQYKYELEDKIYRSLGLLKNSRILSSKEALDLLSNVRLGLEMGIIDNIDMSFINNMLIDIGSASLQMIVDKELSGKERDIERAKLIREKLN